MISVCSFCPFTGVKIQDFCFITDSLETAKKLGYFQGSYLDLLPLDLLRMIAEFDGTPHKKPLASYNIPGVSHALDDLDAHNFGQELRRRYS